MGSKAVPSLIIPHFIFFIITLHCCISHTDATRKLLDFPGIFGTNPGTNPPATPVHNVGYTSETKGPVHGQVVSKDGQTKSEAGTVKGSDGKRAVEGQSKDGSQTAHVGHKDVDASNANGTVSGTIGGSNGKAGVEANHYNNGSNSVTFKDGNGNPVFQIGTPPLNNMQMPDFSTPFSPQNPQIPDFPPVSSPSNPQIPDFPPVSTPSIPQIPDFPPVSTPSIPQIPSFPSPSAPSIPQIPFFPSPFTPSNPQIPFFPSPSTPSNPHIPFFHSPFTPSNPQIPFFSPPSTP
ncbi:hypothetical protein Tsubulata_014378 [Turnera subulata]|uniref:BURP domain-containing protein n=1 Tax=Turnera subulata TaxID=218843 RepID=A0A9Q0GG55_9ROSI|nr:hypothetical protein Tsubulata_014378 [Turnera subulata]